MAQPLIITYAAVLLVTIAAVAWIIVIENRRNKSQKLQQALIITAALSCIAIWAVVAYVFYSSILIKLFNE